MLPEQGPSGQHPSDNQVSPKPATYDGSLYRCVELEVVQELDHRKIQELAADIRLYQNKSESNPDGGFHHKDIQTVSHLHEESRDD
jgi:hypothetical protein